MAGLHTSSLYAKAERSSDAIGMGQVWRDMLHLRSHVHRCVALLVARAELAHTHTHTRTLTHTHSPQETLGTHQIVSADLSCTALGGAIERGRFPNPALPEPPRASAMTVTYGARMKSHKAGRTEGEISSVDPWQASLYWGCALAARIPEVGEKIRPQSRVGQMLRVAPNARQGLVYMTHGRPARPASTGASGRHTHRLSKLPAFALRAEQRGSRRGEGEVSGRGGRCCVVWGWGRGSKAEGQGWRVHPLRPSAAQLYGGRAGRVMRVANVLAVLCGVRRVVDLWRPP